MNMLNIIREMIGTEIRVWTRKGKNPADIDVEGALQLVLDALVVNYDIGINQYTAISYDMVKVAAAEVEAWALATERNYL